MTWLDFNYDGSIDMRNVAASTRAFGSFGDPTKTVSVETDLLARDVES